MKKFVTILLLTILFGQHNNTLAGYGEIINPIKEFTCTAGPIFCIGATTSYVITKSCYKFGNVGNKDDYKAFCATVVACSNLIFLVLIPFASGLINPFYPIDDLAIDNLSSIALGLGALAGTYSATCG